VVDFLEALTERGKRRVLVTNAHQKSIALKMDKTRLAGHFDRIVCSHELRAPKESAEFWPRLQAIEPFDRQRTLFVDDSLSVLASARAYGFSQLLAILEPDSKAPPRAADGFPAIRHFADLLPGLRAA
jgi:putative hydrolase of the HAD superfamily